MSEEFGPKDSRWPSWGANPRQGYKNQSAENQHKIWGQNEVGVINRDLTRRLQKEWLSKPEVMRELLEGMVEAYCRAYGFGHMAWGQEHLAIEVGTGQVLWGNVEIVEGQERFVPEHFVDRDMPDMGGRNIPFYVYPQREPLQRIQPENLRRWGDLQPVENGV